MVGTAHYMAFSCYCVGWWPMRYRGLDLVMMSILTQWQKRSDCIHAYVLIVIYLTWPIIAQMRLRGSINETIIRPQDSPAERSLGFYGMLVCPELVA